MYSTKDFEKLWFRYKTEGEPTGQSIERYCMKMGVPYKQFEKWFRSTRKEIIPIKIDGAPESDFVQSDTIANDTSTEPCSTSVSENRILVIVRSSNGFKLQQGGLDYAGLKRLIEKIEGLC